MFNLKDKLRYEQEYPSIDILYFVDWIPVKADINGKLYEVTPHRGIYRTSFQELNTLLVAAPLHSYMQRRDDTQGNAKSSYVIDVRNPIFEKLL